MIEKIKNKIEKLLKLLKESEKLKLTSYCEIISDDIADYAEQLRRVIMEY